MLLVANLIWTTHPVGSLDHLYGWPLPFAERFADAPDSWYDGRYVKKYDDSAVLVNLGVGLWIVAGTAWIVERWRRQKNAPLQVGIKTLCVATAWVACLVVFGGKRIEPLLRETSILAGLIGLALAWKATFDGMGVLWSWFADRRNQPSPSN
jgi:hypothetical protein